MGNTIRHHLMLKKNIYDQNQMPITTASWFIKPLSGPISISYPLAVPATRETRQGWGVGHAPARRADRPSGGERLHAGSPVSRRTGAQTWGRTCGVEMRKQQCQWSTFHESRVISWLTRGTCMVKYRAAFVIKMQCVTPMSVDLFKY